jgi:hypothetical protein
MMRLKTIMHCPNMHLALVSLILKKNCNHFSVVVVFRLCDGVMIDAVARICDAFEVLLLIRGQQQTPA